MNQMCRAPKLNGAVGTRKGGDNGNALLPRFRDAVWENEEALDGNGECCELAHPRMLRTVSYIKQTLLQGLPKTKLTKQWF